MRKTKYVNPTSFALIVSLGLPVTGIDHPEKILRNVVGQDTRMSAMSWLPDTFPADPADPTCHSATSLRFCDPDLIMTGDAKFREQLGDLLEDRSHNDRLVSLKSSCYNNQSLPHQTSVDVKVQYAVALVNKMNQSNRSSPLYGKNSERAAELFARQVHDTWGVGVQTDNCGGTGILLFLSDKDRSIFISRGSALESVLTDYRLDNTIERMKPKLRNKQYGAAILGALQEIDNYLIVGQPGRRERFNAFCGTYMGYGVVLAIFAFVGFAIKKDQRERREYAKVASQLNEMDRARAEALQGRFQARSCPICLEDFKMTDDKTTNVKEENEVAVENRQIDPAKLQGCDGLPLKLLRCGHVYCDSCFSDWVSSGHYNKVDKCPICQQDVREEGTTTMNSAPGYDSISDHNNDRIGEETLSRAYRQYARDRSFRLMRLHRRYPHFVRQNQIDRWTSVGYNGSMARDPTFVSFDPVLRAQQSSNSNGRSGSGGSGFGGGRSGGGRGGRW